VGAGSSRWERSIARRGGKRFGRGYGNYGSWPRSFTVCAKLRCKQLSAGERRCGNFAWQKTTLRTLRDWMVTRDAACARPCRSSRPGYRECVQLRCEFGDVIVGLHILLEYSPSQYVPFVVNSRPRGYAYPAAILCLDLPPATIQSVDARCANARRPRSQPAPELSLCRELHVGLLPFSSIPRDHLHIPQGQSCPCSDLYRRVQLPQLM